MIRLTVAPLRAILCILAGVFLLLGVVHMAAASEAPAYPESGCGLPAVGLQLDGSVWPADGKPRAAPNMQVHKGYWKICEAWVKYGELARPADPPRPKPCQGQGSVAWTVGEATCTARLPAAGSGFSSLATQDQGPMRGQATYQCTDGQWVIDASRSHCAEAPACDNLQTIRFGSDEACSVTYDARAARARLLTGTEVALPADAKPGWSGSAVLRCEYGSLAIKTTRCVKQ